MVRLRDQYGQSGEERETELVGGGWGVGGLRLSCTYRLSWQTEAENRTEKVEKGTAVKQDLTLHLCLDDRSCS